MTDLHDLSTTQLLAQFASRTLSPLDYYEHLLAHVGRWEPHIRALYAFDPEQVRLQARAATERWNKGAPNGPLDGIPVTIKELIATQGTPIPLGSAATTLKPALQDAPPAARMREAGAIILAKTTVPDFGMLSSGLSSFHGITRNPGTPPAIPVAPVPAPLRPPRPVMDRCTSAPTSAARCACRPPGAGWWGSSRPWGGFPSTPTTPDAAPGP